MITIESLTKDFLTAENERIRVLNAVSFEVASNSSVAIKGPSGSGKSTLLGILAGLEKPTHGSVTMDNAVVTSLSENDLARFRARHLGFVFQQFHLLPHFSAFQNVLIAAEISEVPSPRKQALESLERVGLSARVHHLPSQLSGGECQRVAIARAMVTKPSILLCDEPTGSLDPANADKIFLLLQELRQELKTTMILVTHDANLAERMDTVVELERGEVKIKRPGLNSGGLK